MRLWQSGLPNHWYPCATEKRAFNAGHERGTSWKATHAELFRDFSDPLRGWISYNFTGETHGDFIRALSEKVTDESWERVCAGERNMWSTASLVMAAGRDLVLTDQGWRFLSSTEADGRRTWPWRLDPIKASTNDDGWIAWKISEKESRDRLFGREGGVGYGAAMEEALNALLKGLMV
ncbi:MAG: hypothetical protein WEB33_10360 [Bacteroidota bacterium]